MGAAVRCFVRKRHEHSRTSSARREVLNFGDYGVIIHMECVPLQLPRQIEAGEQHWHRSMINQRVGEKLSFERCPVGKSAKDLRDP